MPPKRATRGAAPTEKKATRATRSRAAEETPPEAQSTEQTSARSTRTRRSAVAEDGPEQSTPKAAAAQPEDAPAQPRTVQRPLTRGRPPRTVKKVAPSRANKETLDAMRKRMEDERRVTGAGAAPEQQPESRAGQAEKAVREAENSDNDKALAPAFPTTSTPPRQAVPGTATKPPATVTRPQSALKVQSTPGADTSVLALQNFRRRPRQPSLLQMVQNPDLDTGNDTTDFTLGTSDDEDDFAPHDEGTPLHMAKAGPQEDHEPQVEHAQTPPPVQAAEDDEDLYGATPQRPRQSRSRKRKSDTLDDDTEVQVARSSPSLPHSPRPSATPSDLDIIPATAPSDDQEEPAATESQQRRLLSDTFADPLSSSPPASPMSPSSPQQTRQPSASASPSAIRKSTRTAGEKSTKQKPLTTATLRALLPKRRRRNGVTIPKDDFDIPSSSSQDLASSGYEDDRRRRGGARAKASKAKTAAAAKKGAMLSPVTATKRKPALTTEKAKKTYARRTSDKENTPNVVAIPSGGGDSSSSLSELESGDEGAAAAEDTLDTSVSTVTADKGGGADADADADAGLTDELKRARQKFADVDRWEMDFESASVGAGGDSSPWR